MASRQKYMFETAFDKGAAEGNAKPLPTHTDEDVERAREAAFQAGHEAALVAAREIEERRIKEMFATISKRIDGLCATRAADNELLAGRATQVAVAICRKILPAMARRHALTEIEGLIGDCIAEMPEEPRIVVRVADELVDRLQQRMATYANGFEGRLVLLGDDAISETDCAVVWADGGTERNLDRLWRDIDAAIARNTADEPAIAGSPDEPMRDIAADHS
jgi:flagellar assembly protein FliH